MEGGMMEVEEEMKEFEVEVEEEIREHHDDTVSSIHGHRMTKDTLPDLRVLDYVAKGSHEKSFPFV